MSVSVPTRSRARAESQKRRRLTSNPTFWRGVMGVVGFIVVLEVISRSGLIKTSFLPPFSEVLWKSITLWGVEQFRVDVLATVVTYALGMLIAIVIAVPIGILFGLSKPLYRSARALVELMRPVPPVALVPLVILVLGSGLEMKLVLVVFAAIWPIMFNTLYGVNDVDPAAKEMATSFGINSKGVLTRIIIPSASPFIATGVRIASSIALIVVITVELIAGGATGIGAFISRERAYGDAESYIAVLAATISAGAIGLVVNSIIGSLERRFFGWDSTTKEA